MPNLKTDLPLLALLALIWGSSYLFIKIAVAEIPPLTLVALRVFGATCFLALVMRFSGERLPRGRRIWRLLLVQSFLTSIGAWTVLSWGQQFVDASLASVLNSTSPLFVFFIVAVVSKSEGFSTLKLTGALLGLCGVILIVGVDALKGLGTQVLGQSACLLGALFYALAAINGKRFTSIGALATATGTMLWASVVMIPVALVVDRPWSLSPSTQAIVATAVLSLLCTGVALLLYFRLLKSLGSLGVASQAYLRASVGVFLSVVFLGEELSAPIALGLVLTILGVALINWPVRK